MRVWFCVPLCFESKWRNICSKFKLKKHQSFSGGSLQLFDVFRMEVVYRFYSFLLSSSSCMLDSLRRCKPRENFSFGKFYPVEHDHNCCQIALETDRTERFQFSNVPRGNLERIMVASIVNIHIYIPSLLHKYIFTIILSN